MSYDLGFPLGNTRPMAGASDDFDQGFIERTRVARRASGFTQAEIAELFGMKQDLWKTYETRTPLPHRYIPRFCLAVRCDMIWLLTGKGSPPDPAPSVRPHKARRLPRHPGRN